MVGRLCRVEPLNDGRHAEALYRAYAEAHDECDWTYLSHERETDPGAFHAFIAQRAASPDPFHMAVVCEGEALGATAFMRIDESNGVLELGHIHFAPRLQRTAAATEALYLMMSRAFDELGYRRLEWKCDALNARSRAAAVRLGFLYEGTFRNAAVSKQRSRDTAWFAVTNDRWEELRRAFDTWLSPSNFSKNGQQIKDLKTFTGGAA